MHRIKYAANVSKRSMALISLGLILLLAQAIGHTEASGALPFSRGYLITGGYVVGGVNLAPASGGGGFLTGTINMSGTNHEVPANADILAAFLYWGSVTTNISQAAGAQFRGSPLTNVKATSVDLTPEAASCWTSGGGAGALYTMTMFSADVLHLLPIQKDVNDQPAGRRIVNDTDLEKYGYALHTVTLPESGTGNQVPSSPGASLFVIYRLPTMPLTSISVYEGVYVQAPGVTMTQTMRGFLKSSTSPDARMTQIVGSGAKNPTNQVWFDSGPATSTLLATNAFQGTNNANSARAWANPTFPIVAPGTSTSLMPGTDSHDGYGETVTTRVDHVKTSPYDCLTWAAIIFSSAVPDLEGDGIPDVAEDSSTDGPVNLVTDNHWKDPSGKLLPDLHAMGAGSDHKDLFTEIGWMTTGGYTGGQGEVPAHNHRPTPAALKMVGDAFWCTGTAGCQASITTPSNRILVHFDVGNDYPTYSGADAYAERYIIRNTTSGLARGGESLTERECVSDTQSPPRWICQFPGYPGTVTWKRGFLALRGAFVHDDEHGTELNPLSPVNPGGTQADADFLSACESPAGNCRRRFDRERNNFFHYVLFAHSRGIPKSSDPTSSDFHVPSSSGGRGDLPAGADAVVTLGWWDNFVGTDLNQASVLLHELGHNLGLWHGGDAVKITDADGFSPTKVNVYFEPNCKPNYLSLMNYAFGFTGLLDDDGVPHVDFSGGKIDNIDEYLLRDGALAGSNPAYTPQYRTAWFVPTASTNPAKAKRFCGDKPLPTGWADNMVRVDAQTVAESIDWNRNGSDPSFFSQDINFSGDVSGLAGSPPLHGFNDWASVRLDQVGSRGNQAGFSNAGSDLDFVGGDLDFVGGDLDFVGGDLDFVGGDLDFVGGDLDFVGGDLDFVGGDVEPTFAAGAAMGYASPNTFKACVLGVDCLVSPPPLHRTRSTWNVPVMGSDRVSFYSGYVVQGDTFIPSLAVPVGTTCVVGVDCPPGTSSPTDLVDIAERPHGVNFTYSVTATFNDATVSDYSASKSATITAVNDAPVAIGNHYDVNQGAPLVVTASCLVAWPTDSLPRLVGKGVLCNDTDTDSASLTAVIDTPPSNAAAFTLNPDGSFSYTPNASFVGTDSFTYKAKDVTPISARNVSATVTITVNQVLYGFNPVQGLSPVSPSAKTSKPGSSVPLKWQFTLNGVAFNSFDADPQITIVPPTGVCTTQTIYTPENPGGSSFQPPTVANGYTWQFNWQSKCANGTALPSGTYKVYVGSVKTGQIFNAGAFGPYYVTLK
jgi:hypothetical protein